MEMGELKKLLKWIDCECVCISSHAILVSVTMGVSPLESRDRATMLTLSKYTNSLATQATIMIQQQSDKINWTISFFKNYCTYAY